MSDYHNRIALSYMLVVGGDAVLLVAAIDGGDAAANRNPLHDAVRIDKVPDFHHFRFLRKASL